MTDYKLFPVEPTAEMLGAACDEEQRPLPMWSRMRAIYKAMRDAAPAVQVEPVGWQFYQDGKWWHGDDRTKDHRKNTEEAGVPVRDVYAVPQTAPDVEALVEALELARNDLKEWLKSFPNASREPTVKIIERIDTAIAAHRQQEGGGVTR